MERLNKEYISRKIKNNFKILVKHTESYSLNNFNELKIRRLTYKLKTKQFFIQIRKRNVIKQNQNKIIGVIVKRINLKMYLLLLNSFLTNIQSKRNKFKGLYTCFYFRNFLSYIKSKACSKKNTNNILIISNKKRNSNNIKKLFNILRHNVQFFNNRNQIIFKQYFKILKPILGHLFRKKFINTIKKNMIEK